MVMVHYHTYMREKNNITAAGFSGVGRRFAMGLNVLCGQRPQLGGRVQEFVWKTKLSTAIVVS
jgi:hypothetical protein